MPKKATSTKPKSKSKTKGRPSKDKTPAVPPPPPLTWQEKIARADLNSLEESRSVKFCLLNAEGPDYVDHIHALQIFVYQYSNLDVKPILYREIVYLIRHYPAWDRPYFPQEYELSFEKACLEAKGFLKKLKPIPLDLMAILIKLRAMMYVYEDAYCENRPDLTNLVENVSTCSSYDYFSYDDDVFEKSQERVPELAMDEISWVSECEYDRDTMQMIYNASSPAIQKYIRTMESRSRNIVGTKDIKLKITNFYPWTIRHCKYKKGYRMSDQKRTPKSEKSSPLGHDRPRKLLFMSLSGFYDEQIVRELNALGMSLECLLAFGGEQTGVPQPKVRAQQTDPSFKCWTLLLSNDYSSKYSRKHKFKRDFDGTLDDPVESDRSEEDSELKDKIITPFWIKMEQLCELSLPYTRDIIWFRYSSPPLTEEERKFGSVAFKWIGAKLHKMLTAYLNSIGYLKNYHELYSKMLSLNYLQEDPEVVPVKKMFYYNEALRPIPSDCLDTGYILEALLDEVCHRTPDTSTTNPSSCSFAKIEHSIEKRRRKKLLSKILRKYRFSYMPSDPTAFMHAHPDLMGTFGNLKILRGQFEVHESDELDLKTRYYPKLRAQLKNSALGHLRKTFPALLWRLYPCDDDYDHLSSSSHVYQTWLSIVKLRDNECKERMAVRMCERVRCKERKKAYAFCDLHDYFVKPIWIPDDTKQMVVKSDLQKNCKITVSTPQKSRDDKGTKRFPKNIRWQESLSPEAFLQQTKADCIYFDCFDHLYIPFVDSIVLRFHDPTDDFGTAVYIWTENIRSPIGLYNFFKHTIFEESEWFQTLEDVLPPFTLFTNQPSEDLPDLDNFRKAISDIPQLKETLSHLEPLEAFNLDDRKGAGGTTTIFRSSEGLKVTVDVNMTFGTKTISIKVQGDDNLFVLHANPEAPFLFHFEAANGVRMIFGKPENEAKNVPKGLLERKKPKKRNLEENKVNLIEEVEELRFPARSEFPAKRYVTDKILQGMFSKMLFQADSNFSPRDSLWDVESDEEIHLRTVPSLTDINRKHPTWLKSDDYKAVFRSVRRMKRATIPHFKILSSALHKRKYVAVRKATITLHFQDCTVPIKYIPNVDVSKRIQFSKCYPEMDLPSLKTEPRKTSKNYDIRIILPSGLQIRTFPDPDDPTKHLVVQSYLTTNPGHVSIHEEVSRTFTKNGCVRIKYRDGSVKLIGLNGRQIRGRSPCLNRRPTKKRQRKRSSNYHKCSKLLQSIHRKLNRFQGRFVDKPGVKYLNRKISRRDKFFKTLLDNFIDYSKVLDYSKLTLKQLLLPVDFEIDADSFKNHDSFNYSTKDSFTSIGEEGILTTTFIDGTRITSLFKIDQEMIASPSNRNCSVIDIDRDDYTCNFLIPRPEGWIDVKLQVQIEHPQYATVVFKSNGEEVSILLPDNTEVQFRSDGSYYINMNDLMYSNITTEEIKIKSNFCKKCYDSCNTTIYISNLYQNVGNINPSDLLLEAKDNFNRNFMVEYSGLCQKNDDYYTEHKNDCQLHRSDTTEKFYCFNRNLEGVAYWIDTTFTNRILKAQANPTHEHVKHYLDENQSLRAYEIRSYFPVHYCDRFTMPYVNSDPPALIKLKSKPKCFGPVAYTKKRFVNLLPDPEPINLLLKAIDLWQTKRPWELKLPTREILEEDLTPKVSKSFAKSAFKEFAALSKMAETYTIENGDDINSMTRPLVCPICKCSKRIGTCDHSIKTKPSPKKPKSSLNTVKLPAVPVNSRCTVASTVKSLMMVALLTEKEPSYDDPSLTEFQSKTIVQKPLLKKEQPTTSFSIVPFFKPGYTEWRKAMGQESSSSTNSIFTEPQKIKKIKRKRNEKNKSTETERDFDLLQSKSKKQPIEDIRSNAKFVLSKHSRLFAMKSIEKLEEKLSNTKCAPRLGKRSSTDIRKARISEGADKRAELPLILKDNATKKNK